MPVTFLLPRHLIADLIIRVDQGGWAQVLLMRGFQDVIGDVTGLGHAEIAMVHGLRNNHRHQAVLIGDLLGVARLQGRHRRQEVALLIHKSKNVGDVACLKLGVEALLPQLVLICNGSRLKLAVLAFDAFCGSN
jgi:hypothetical protein